MAARIRPARAPQASTATGVPPAVEASAVGGGVDAERQSADDRHARRRRARAKLIGHLVPVRGRPARAHDRNRRPRREERGSVGVRPHADRTGGGVRKPVELRRVGAGVAADRPRRPASPSRARSARRVEAGKRLAAASRPPGRRRRGDQVLVRRVRAAAGTRPAPRPSSPVIRGASIGDAVATAAGRDRRRAPSREGVMRRAAPSRRGDRRAPPRRRAQPRAPGRRDPRSSAPPAAPGRGRGRSGRRARVPSSSPAATSASSGTRATREPRRPCRRCSSAPVPASRLPLAPARRSRALLDRALDGPSLVGAHQLQRRHGAGPRRPGRCRSSSGPLSRRSSGRGSACAAPAPFGRAPQGHRLQAATSMNSAGNSSVRCPRMIRTRPSSSG